MERGRIVSSDGLDIDVREYDEHFVEEHVEHSNALHSRLRERGAYCVGPMARFALNADRLSPAARDAAAEVGLDAAACQNPFRSILVRVRRARPRVRRGAASDRALAAARATRRRPRARAGDRLRLQRGAARAALPPLLDRRRRRDPRRHDRAADIAEPAHHRARPRPRSSGTTSTCRTTRSRSPASRRSATTTRASRAPPTSCGSRSIAGDSTAPPHHRPRERAPGRRRGGPRGRAARARAAARGRRPGAERRAGRAARRARRRRRARRARRRRHVGRSAGHRPPPRCKRGRAGRRREHHAPTGSGSPRRSSSVGPSAACPHGCSCTASKDRTSRSVRHCHPVSPGPPIRSCIELGAL